MNRRIIVLDSTPIGLITNPKPNPLAQECQSWLKNLLIQEFIVVLPEITDYEIRRELLRLNKKASLRKLDQLKNTIAYLPLTTPMMIKAAELWAEVRKSGKPTADNKALDGDVILAAQALVLQEKGYDVAIATNNVKHLSLFISAQQWQEI